MMQAPKLAISAGGFPSQVPHHHHRPTRPRRVSSRHGRCMQPPYPVIAPAPVAATLEATGPHNPAHRRT